MFDIPTTMTAQFDNLYNTLQHWVVDMNTQIAKRNASVKQTNQHMDTKFTTPGVKITKLLEDIPLAVPLKKSSSSGSAPP